MECGWRLWQLGPGPQGPGRDTAGHCTAVQTTVLLFRPLAHGVCLHLVSCIDLPSGSWALRDGGHCVVWVTVTALGDL